MFPSENIPLTSQKMPEKWPDLLALSETALARDPQNAALEVLRGACQLDIDTIDINAYYGLSLGSWGLVKALRNSDIRAGITQEAARTTARDHLSYCRDHNYYAVEEKMGLRVSEIRASHIGFASSAAIKQSVQLLSPAELLLTDALSVAHPGIRSEPRLRSRAAAMNSVTPTLRRIRENSFSGATAMAKVVLLKMYEQSAGCNPLEANPKVSAIPKVELERPDIIKVATQIAALHLNRIGPGVGEAIILDEDGFQFNGAAVLNQPELQVGQTQRQALIGCPALYIRDLIPLALKTVAETIPLADSAIRNIQ